MNRWYSEVLTSNYRPTRWRNGVVCACKRKHENTVYCIIIIIIVLLYRHKQLKVMGGNKRFYQYKYTTFHKSLSIFYSLMHDGKSIGLFYESSATGISESMYFNHIQYSYFPFRNMWYICYPGHIAYVRAPDLIFFQSAIVTIWFSYFQYPEEVTFIPK